MFFFKIKCNNLILLEGFCDQDGRQDLYSEMEQESLDTGLLKMFKIKQNKHKY